MHINYNDLVNVLEQILTRYEFNKDRASICAAIFAANSRDGVHSHGLNRFPVFIDYIKKGLINVNASPETTGQFGSLEQWNGHLAPGMYTASLAMDRAIEIAKEKGMGCVAVHNTNHWMRGGTYGWQAAEKGCIAICGTNAIANMPPYGGTEPTLANNPLVIAVPRKEGHLVLDLAMSQFSYGKLQEYQLRGAKLPVDGGYDQQGNLTKDPEEIMRSKRSLPIGFWKGSGLSLMMDVLVSVLSGGNNVKRITALGDETAVSQFFLAISPASVDGDVINEIIEYTKTSAIADEGSTVRYPGEQTLIKRNKSMTEGVFVNDDIWEKVNHL